MQKNNEVSLGGLGFWGAVGAGAYALSKLLADDESLNTKTEKQDDNNNGNMENKNDTGLALQSHDNIEVKKNEITPEGLAFWGAVGASAYALTKLLTGDESLNAKEYKLDNNYKYFLRNYTGKYFIIKTVKECDDMVEELRKQCDTYSVLGFGCHWESQGDNRKVGLLQLFAIDGTCGLFRLCFMDRIPTSLRRLLEDHSILKVSIATPNDAQRFEKDFDVHIRGAFDLRFLAEMTDHEPQSLSRMSKCLLNVELDRNLAWSDWYAKELDSAAEVYAATDAHVGLEIFMKLSLKLEPTLCNLVSSEQLKRVRRKICYKIDQVYC